MDISKIRLENETYDIKDSQARTDIASLSDRIDDIDIQLDSGKTIFIGDSYAVGNTRVSGIDQIVDGWVEYLVNILGLSSSQYYKFCEGGIGFADSGQGGHLGFLDLLQSNISTITDKNIIKNVIVCAGYNDANQQFSAIDGAIFNFISYCKTQFPNAKIYIGMVGNNSAKNDTGRNFRRKIRQTVIPAYTTCRAYGAIYLNGVENIMKYYPNMSEDTIHPTPAGYRILAQCIFQALKNGKVTYILPESSVTWENSSNINFGSFLMQSQIADNITQFKIQSGNMQFTNPISLSGGYIDLGAINCNNFRFTDYGDLAIPIFCGIRDTSNNQFGGIGMMTINNQNHLIIGFRPYKNDGTGIGNLSVSSVFIDTANQSIPTLNC